MKISCRLPVPAPSSSPDHRRLGLRWIPDSSERHLRRAARWVEAGRATSIGSVDLNKKRIRGALSAVLALASAPYGVIVSEFAAKVHAVTGTSDAGYTIRQAAYELRKRRGKQLVGMRHAATEFSRWPHAPSPPCSPCATR